jgi:hypothetical protein
MNKKILLILFLHFSLLNAAEVVSIGEGRSFDEAISSFEVRGPKEEVFWRAIVERHISTVQLMLNFVSDKFALIFYRDEFTKRTTLHLALQKHATEIVELLLDAFPEEDKEKKKRFVRARDENGDTSLCYAARGGHIDIVKKLLDIFSTDDEKREFVNIKNNDAGSSWRHEGEDAFDIAFQRFYSSKTRPEYKIIMDILSPYYNGPTKICLLLKGWKKIL